MPTYDYECKECGHVVEKMLRMADREDPIKAPCENCKKEGTVFQKICAVARAGFNVLGNHKPGTDFKERMKQIKQGLKYAKNTTFKDY